MASRSTLQAVAVTFLVVAAATALVGTRTMVGNDRVCWEGDQQVACTEEQHVAMEMVANAMGDLVFSYAVLLGLIGAGFGIAAMRQQPQ